MQRLIKFDSVTIEETREKNKRDEEEFINTKSTAIKDLIREIRPFLLFLLREIWRAEE
jgi:hypothetical protein